MTNAGAVLLFWFDVEVDEAAAARLVDSLDPHERARATRVLDPAHSRRYVAAHAGVRTILGRALGVEPAVPRFVLGSNGKPALDGGGLHFNLSHSGSFAMVGICREFEIGVDIERERPNLDVLALARRFFTANETRWLIALPEAQRHLGFCRLWTCKEAWLKSDGRGLTLPLDQVEVTFGSVGTEMRGSEQSWYVREMNAPPAGYCAAVVAAQPISRVTTVRLYTPSFEEHT